MSDLNTERISATRIGYEAEARRLDRGARLPLPPIERISMAPRPLQRRWRRHAAPVCSASVPAWVGQARRRRAALALLVFVQTALACWSLARTFPYAELTYLQYAIIGLFAILFSWISFSFWSNVAAFFTLWRKAEAIDHASVAAAAVATPLRARTAVLMPICNEDADRCFRAVEAMCRSLDATGEGDKFDFFVLSDSGSPQSQAAEAREWRRAAQALDGLGRIYYRHRRVNIKHKSGNIADFLRRWSRPYEYMIVLDADSIMTGTALVGLARVMEASPQVGILQSAPTIVNGASLFARVQQFASRAYGPLFGAGLRFWQLGESYYWGHNAILRVQPFVQHCGLARLPGEAPLGGEILSHDFVEAALMGKAGYEVRLMLDLPGSYEESPPTLLDELKRDRRWCQGNLQHLRLLFAEGFTTGHRAIFALGIMAYVSAFFWAGFLILNTVELTTEAFTVPDYFSARPSLFPTWPQWHPEWAIALATTTALLLFLPKLLSFALIVKAGAAHRFGGVIPLAASIVLEVALSTLLAPSRMWFHTKYVLLTLLGRPIKWHTQQRAGAGTAWREAARAHGLSTVAAAAWVTILYWLSPLVFVWLLPVAVPLLLSIPLSVLSSRASIGAVARRWRLFTIPEENSPPPVLEELKRLLAHGDGAIPQARAIPSGSRGAATFSSRAQPLAGHENLPLL